MSLPAFARCLTAFVLMIWLVTPALCAEHAVASAEDIEQAMKSARPGDVLVMKDGTWTDQEIHFAGKGGKDEPITLRAQTPGGVTLTGSSELLISGEYLVVDGLHFRDGTPDTSSHIIQFRGRLGDARHCRLTNTVIDSYNPPDAETKYAWVSLYGRHNRVDHCRFANQAHEGVTVVVWLDGGPAHHRIDHNHFHDRPEGDGNGFETIRLGSSKHSTTNAFVTVDHNLFERVDGEMEIISNKCNDNTFRFNTFRESAGTLTLRHGHRATVQGNYFLGMGKARSGGIRVIGEDHVITHNYIAEIDDRADGAISMAAGIRNTQPNGYQQVKRARIEHNTIVEVGGSGITFDWGIGERKRTLIPEALTISRNVIYSSRAPLLEGAVGDDWTWRDNIVFGAKPGVEVQTGVRQVDPALKRGPDGLWRPVAGSPAANIGAALPPAKNQADTDEPANDGERAPVDADEFRMPHPLTARDVGPRWAAE